MKDFASKVIVGALKRKIRIARATLDDFDPDDGVDNDTKLVLSGKVQGLEEARTLIVSILGGIEDGRFSVNVGEEHEGGFDIEVLLVPLLPCFTDEDHKS